MSRICFVVFLFLISAPGVAQQQSHIDAAAELVDAMNSEESLQQTYDMLIPQMSKMGAKMGVDEEREPSFERYMEEMVVVMKDVVSWERMQPLLVNSYVEVFTEGELRELTEFYTSPIGRKYIAKQPELAAAAVEVTGEMLQELMPRLNELRIEMRSDVTQSQPDSH